MAKYVSLEELSTPKYIFCVLVKYTSLEKLRTLEYMLCVFERVGDIETNINLTCNILPISHDPMNMCTLSCPHIRHTTYRRA